MNRTNIPIFFSFNRNYCLPAAVAIHSMLKYANKTFDYKLYVLHTELQTKDEQMLKKIVQRFENVSLQFMNISECDLEAGCKNIVSYHYSKEAMSRLFADIYFPQYEKIIYSDVDVVFTDDVSQAWITPIKESCYVAGIKYLPDGTTCSGFLIMNLKKIREDRMGEQWREVMETNQQGWWDQDIINACCQSNIDLLPLRFTVCQIYYSSKTVLRTDLYPPKEMKEAMNRPMVIHYCTGNKPWNTIFSQKQSVWLRELMDTGLVGKFIFCFPLWTLKWFLKNHNLFRGIRKARKYILKKIIYTINNKR